MNPHIPYHFPPEYASMYPSPSDFLTATHPTLDPSQPVVAWYDQGDTPSSPVGIATYGDVRRSGGVNLHKSMNETEARIIRRNNYATTTFTDAQLGRVLTALDVLNLTNSTIVCSFADHGQALGEHNLWEKMSLFEASTRVHLIIRAPWLPHSVGKTSPAVVELVSLYRTLVELAGIPVDTIEPSVQGTSFAPLVSGSGAAAVTNTFHGEPGTGFALSQMTRCGGEGPNPNPRTSVYWACGFTSEKRVGGLRNYTYMGYSVRSAGWRLSIWARWNYATLCPDWTDATNQVELYDHRNDSAIVDFDSTENVNVASDPENVAVIEQLTEVANTFFSEGCKTKM